MKFSNFLFPHSPTPDSDYDAVTDALREAELTEELGFDAVWLGEHHIDGACAYVDPVTFAAAVAARTRRVQIGFAAVQMALHHPIRLAEEIALIDNISNGRIILGIGRGTAYNFYEYRSYGIPFSEAQGRLLESEDILPKAWTTENYRHKGEYFDIDLPVLRPKVYQNPHPPMIRAVATEGSMVEMGKQGRPLMLVVQPDDETERRFSVYQDSMRDSGYDEAHVKWAMENSWIWRNMYVAENDADAERVATRVHVAGRTHINETRLKLNTAEEMSSVSTGLADPRFRVENSMIFGSPDTVAKRIERLQGIGIGGLILQFRVGPMSWEDNEASLRLFANEVMPRFRAAT
ncbi:MAG: LLM class flavin-dependent oxidoreductase [Dehalococcoidia bacterium]|nr:LLM class flavin-dependent oxidoreductase [Dehalococcoidia bacterium]